MNDQVVLNGSVGAKTNDKKEIQRKAFISMLHLLYIAIHLLRSIRKMEGVSNYKKNK